MDAITLTTTDQATLRAVLTAEPVPGTPLPTRDLLGNVAALLPCDGIGVLLVDNRGHTVDQIDLNPDLDVLARDVSHGGGPYYIGVMHWSVQPAAAQACQALVGLVDAVSIGYRNGPEHVAQLYLARVRRRFSERELAIMHLLTPVLQRLLRERPTSTLPPALTLAERRVLMQVAAGYSNAKIAESLFVAPSTVRKHLEHSFRKLGVTSRLAAVARLQGRDQPDLDLRERIERLG